jgi:hypothetical protein
VARPLKGRILQALGLAVLLEVLLSAPAGAVPVTVGSPGQGSTGGESYPSTSWAIGMVVPEGAGLQGGGALRWASVSNLTCLLTLPSFASPDGIVYAVMSAMIGDGSVLQAAAGVYPNSSLWLGFAWFVQGVQTSQPTYLWVLNSSQPPMSAGDRVSLSIFRGSGQWNVGLVDLSTGASFERAFPAGTASTIMPGDQEVFALESYSRTASDFVSMGNLTLYGVFADGHRVTGGFYSYSGWDPDHNPVFAVGSSGTSPPLFVTLLQGSGGSLVWTYSDVWDEGVGTQAGPWIVVALGLAAVAFVVVAAVVTLVQRKAASGPS